MAVAIDSVGDVIAAGEYNAPADIGSGTAKDRGTYLTKRFAANGTERWTRKLLADRTSGATIRDLAIDGADRIIAVGSYRGSVDFGGTALYRPSDSPTTFVAVYSPVGALVWVRHLDDSAQPSAVAVDQQGNIYITGTFRNSTLVFNGQLFVEADNDADTFVAAFDPGGTLLWGTALQGGGFGPWGFGIAVTATDDVVVAGYFSAPMSLGGPVLKPDARIRSFVTRWHSDGTYVSSQAIGPTAPYSAGAPDVTIDAAGHIVIQQHETDDSEDASASAATRVTLRVYDDAMRELWASRLENHGSLVPQPRSLTTTPTGFILSSAWADVRFERTGAMEVAAFDASGARSIENFGARVQHAMPRDAWETVTSGTAAGTDGAIAFTGTFAGIVDFGTGATFTTRGIDDTDSFLIVVDPPDPAAP
jgi:hypothetical protein